MSFTSLIAWLFSAVVDFSLPSWYLFTASLVFSIWTLIIAILSILTCLRNLTYSFFLRRLVYPLIIPRIRILGAATRFEFLVLLLYFTTNALLITVGAKSRIEISSRAAVISTINLIPLLCGPRIVLISQMLRIPLRIAIGSHRWIGRVAIAEVIVHTVLSLKSTPPTTWTFASLAGLMGTSAMGLILLTSVEIVRRALYEWFLNSHIILAAVVVISIWRHIVSKEPAQIFLQIGICLWSLVTIIHWFLFAKRNVALGRSFATAIVTRLSNKDPSESPSLTDPSNVFQVDITVPRPWQVTAGQYIYLSIPRLGVLTGLRGHPFMISWWNWSEDGLRLTLIIESKKGFTGKLNQYMNKPLLAFIDGPFGGNYGMGDYGTVIMFATGIGIAGHMPFIKELVRGYNSCEIRTRRILLVWQIEKECQERWVKSWMDELLDVDTGYIIKIALHVQDYGKKDLKYGEHSMVNKFFSPPDVVRILDGEFKTQRGMILVSLCAHNVIADSARDHIRKGMTKRVHLVELDFQPSQRKPDRLSATGMEFKCQG